jgi:hypothetical protein
MGFYSQYKGKNIGRMMHFLYDKLHILNSDRCIFHDDGRITLFNEPFATVEWIDDETPKFSFLANYHYQVDQERLISSGEWK